MKARRRSLITSLLASLVLPGALAVMIGTFIVYSVVREKYGELQDTELAVKTQLLLKLYEGVEVGAPAPDAPVISDALEIENALREPDERSLFWVLDSSKRILVQSPGAHTSLLPNELNEGFSTENDHRFYILRSEGDTPVTLVGSVPLHERNTTVRDAVLGVLFGFLLLSSIFIAIAFWSVRRSVGTVESLARNISEKNEHNLTPIDRKILLPKSSRR